MQAGLQAGLQVRNVFGECCCARIASAALAAAGPD